MSSSESARDDATTLSTILDRTTDAVYALDEEWRYVYINEAGSEMNRRYAGKSAADLLGEVVWEAIPEFREAEIYDRAHEAMDFQRPVAYEEYFESADAWFDVRLFPSPDGLSVHARDITEHRRLEAESRLKGLALDRVDDVVWATDETWHYTFANEATRAAAEEWDHDGDLLGECIWEAVPEAKETKLYEHARRALETQEVVAFEEYLPQVNRWYESRIYPSEDGVTFYARDVSEQKRRELELEQYELILDTITDGVCVIDGDGTIVLVNEAYAELSGYEREALLGESISVVVGEERRSSACAARAALEPGESETMSFDRRRPDGTTIPVEVRFTPFPVDGDPGGTVAVVRDVSDRRQLEDELDAVTSRITDGFYAIGRDWRVSYWNDEMERRLGVAAEEIVGENVLDCFPGLRDNVAYEEFRTAMETQEATTFQSYAAEFDKWTEISVYPSDAGISVYSREITDRKKRERELTEVRERLELALVGTETGVWECDVETEEIIWDETIERIYGLAPGEFEGTYEDFLGSLHPDDRESVMEQTERAVAEMETLSLSYRIVRPDGSQRWIESHGNVFGEGNNSGRFIGVLRDVTDQKERERELERYETIVETASDGIYAADPEMRLTMVNDAFVEMTGYDREELLGNDLSLLADDGGFEEGRSLRDELLAGEREVGVISGAISRKDGTECPCESRIALLRSDEEYLGSVGVTRDVSDRLEYERELEARTERLESVVENAPLLLYALDSEGRFTLFEGVGLEPLGLEAGENVGESVFETCDDDPRLVDAHERALAGESVHVVAERKGLTFENWCRPIFDDGEVVRVIGVGLDVTERTQYENALAALHRSSRDLLHARTDEEVATKVVEASDEVLDLTGVVVYLFDEADNVLRPTAYSEDVPLVVGEPPTFGPGSSITWKTFLDGETVSFDDVRDSEDVANRETSVRSGLYIPLGDHGVLTVISPEVGVFDDETVELVDLFAATAETSLDRVVRERDIKDHQWELQQQASRLEQLNEITEQLRRVERVLVFETTRADLEQAVCEQLTASDRFAFAWIGEGTDDGVDPRTWAGNELGYLDGANCPQEPAARTVADRQPTVVENVADGLRSEPWRSEALSRGFQSVISVPLVYDEMAYGVLTVYATRADGFDSMFRTVFEELGDTIAHAIDAAEAKQGLLTDDVVELDLRIPRASDPLARLARETGGATRFVGLVSGDDGDRLFFSATDAPAEEVVAAAESSVVVSSVRVVSDRDDSRLFEMTVDGPTVATVLTERGAVPREIETESDQTRVLVELPRAVDVRSFVEALCARYPETELAARRDRERSLRTRETFRDELDGALTDRQREVLRTAYLSGYFDVPRQSTGEEIAAVLGITQPTFANHLRSGERKLFELLYHG